MNKCLIALLIAAQVYAVCPADASQDGGAPLDNPLLTFTLIELGLAFNASLVASNPNDVGKFVALFGIPYSIALTHTDDSATAKWAVPLVTAAYAAYYIDLDEDEKSETEIFQENMIAMHAVFAIGIASGFLLDTNDGENGFNRNFSNRERATYLGFMPLADGGQFRFMHRF